MVSATEALQRLIAGNRRFVADAPQSAGFTSAARRAQLAGGQQPFAIVLGCSDSRVPAEIVFDQGLGDLFVIRVAGNVVAPSLVGSVEFAAEQFGTRLVVVLGHSRCGAVMATLAQMEQSEPASPPSANVGSIVDRIRPALLPLRGAPAEDGDAALAAAVRANIRASADHLRHGSAVLERLIAEDGLLVVGAEYELGTGEVQFFDGVPAGVGPA